MQRTRNVPVTIMRMANCLLRRVPTRAAESMELSTTRCQEELTTLPHVFCGQTLLTPYSQRLIGPGWAKCKTRVAKTGEFVVPEPLLRFPQPVPAMHRRFNDTMHTFFPSNRDQFHHSLSSKYTSFHFIARSPSQFHHGCGDVANCRYRL